MSLTLFMYLCLNQQKVIAAQSPDPNPGAVMENTTQIILEVRPRATYAINTQVVQPGQLQSELRGIYAARPDKTIIVRGTPGSLPGRRDRHRYCERSGRGGVGLDSERRRIGSESGYSTPDCHSE
jgi:hypothetical protein